MQEDRYACRCCACGKPVQPYPFNIVTKRARRGYPIAALSIDERTGEPCLEYFLKCTRCLPPDSKRHMERWETVAQRMHRSAFRRLRRRRRDDGAHERPLL